MIQQIGYKIVCHESGKRDTTTIRSTMKEVREYIRTIGCTSTRYFEVSYNI